MSKPPCPTIGHGGFDISGRAGRPRSAPRIRWNWSGKAIEKRQWLVVSCGMVDESLFTVKLKLSAFSTSLMSVLVMFFC